MFSLRPCGASLGLALLMTACIDASARFDEFHERTLRAKERDAGRPDEGDASSADAGAPCVAPSAAQLEGRYYVAVIAAIAPDKPILSQMDVVQAKDVSGGIDADVSVRLISAEDQVTPVGEPTKSTLTIRGTRLVMPTTSFFIPGVANPLMQGVEGEVDVSFDGEVCAAAGEPVAFSCGASQGLITEPLIFELKDSTYGALRVVDGEPWPMWRGKCDRGAQQ